MAQSLMRMQLAKTATQVNRSTCSASAWCRLLNQPRSPLLTTSHTARPFSRGAVTRQVRYVRFGDSGSSGGGGGRWRPFRDGKWDRPSKILAGVIGAGTIYYVVHLEKVEETGRWRFIDVSLEAEKKLGKQADEEVVRAYGDKFLPAHHPVTQQVARVASRIITAANLGEVKGVSQSASSSMGGWSALPSSGTGEFGDDEWKDSSPSSPKKTASVVDRLRQEWEVHVIRDDDTPNAFVTGSGNIYVFTGILPVAQDDDGIATVLGHEIAHQVQRHVSEKMSGMKVFSALVLLLEIIGVDIGISRIGLELLMTLPNSRTTESEADNVGLRLMAQACYDPRKSVQLWERMTDLEKKRGGGSGWFNFGGSDFLQTHPANQKRINTWAGYEFCLRQALQQWIPAALQVRAGSSCSLGDDGSSVGDHYQAFKTRFGGL